MSLPWFWHCLELTPEASVREVKRRYSQLLKLNRPEDNPQGFQQLRAAYEICLRLAQQREAEQSADESAAATADDSAPMLALLANTPEQAAAAQRRAQAGTIEPVPASHEQPAAPVPSAESQRPAPLPAAALPVADDPGPAPAQPLIDRADTIDLDPPPLQRTPPVLIDGDPPPAVPHPLAAERIGRFVPVDIVPPTLRDAATVVDELLQLNADNDALVARWFTRCPELMNFDQRDAVELELLRRIAAGARPGLTVLQRAGAEFGWRDLTFPRRLAARGITGPQWQTVDNALHEAYAQAEFQAHLRSGKKLREQSSGPREENYALQRLHAQRGKRPPLRAAFQGGLVLQVNNLLHAYAERYGGRALFHVFGPELLEFWRSVHPNVAPNWTRFRLTALRVMAYGAGAWLMVLGMLAMELDFNFRNPLMPGRLLGGTVTVWSILLLLVGYTGAKLALQHFQQSVWPRFVHWRERLLDRYVEPWLRPARMQPLLGVIAALAVLLDYQFGAGTSALLIVGLTFPVFGFSGLIALLPTGLLLSFAALLWEPPGTLWFAPVITAALGLLWLSDRIALGRVNAQQHWERRFVYALLLSIAVCVASFVVKLTLA